MLAAVVVGLAALLPVAAPASAAGGVDFGTPTAGATFGEGISFRVPVTLSTGVDRVELRLRFPDTLGPTIVDVAPPAGTGTQELRYELDLTGGGSITPNTPITATWVAYTNGQATSSRDVTVTYADTSVDWRTVKGSIVRVHWYEGNNAFAQRALRIGEQAVSETARRLGVTETEPIDFYIYADEGRFRAALGPATRENVGGQAHSDIRTLFALITPDAIDDPWVGIVIPHELTHLVFDTAVRNPYRFPPRWLNEGLATYLSEGYTPSDRNRVEDAVRSQDLIPLDALVGQFPTDTEKTFLAYAESTSAIDYLVRTDGRDALFGLVKAYHDGLTDDEAFTTALGRDLAAFQEGWLSSLGATQPVRYGPQPAPPGPLPEGWTGSSQTPAPGVATPPPPDAPAATPATGPVDGGSGAAEDRGILVLAVVVVVVVVAVGLLVARRRSRLA